MHIGLIMDGNRRWAYKNNINLLEAYRKGKDVFLHFLAWARNTNKIYFITTYAFSSSNWKRSAEEINQIFYVLIEVLEQQALYADQYDTRILFVGRRDRIPSKVLELMNNIEEKTKNCKKYNLQIVVDYDSEWYIEEIIKQNKHPINNFPNIDIMIRSSGEKRLSDYMLFFLAYAELFFIDELWPECTNETFDAVMNEFDLRNRRYGR